MWSFECGNVLDIYPKMPTYSVAKQVSWRTLHIYIFKFFKDMIRVNVIKGWTPPLRYFPRVVREAAAKIFVPIICVWNYTHNVNRTKNEMFSNFAAYTVQQSTPPYKNYYFRISYFNLDFTADNLLFVKKSFAEF